MSPLLRYCGRRPRTWVSVVRAAWALRARGWWHRSPWLPLPDAAYWRFRVATATGSPDGVLEGAEMAAVAKWSTGLRVGR